MQMSRAATAVAGLLFVLAHSAAEAAEVRVISNPGMRSILTDVAAQFERASGHTLTIRYALIEQVRPTIDAGDFDVSISTGAVTDYLAKQAKIVPQARMVVSRGGIGLSTRAGGPKPDIGSVEAFRRAMLNAKSISYTQNSTVGNYVDGMMKRLGIAAEMQPKTRLMTAGGQNSSLVASGEIEFGISLIADIVPFREVELLGPLPPDLQNYVVETGDLGASAKDPQAAAAFLQFLGTPEARAAIKAKGMEPGSP